MAIQDSFAPSVWNRERKLAPALTTVKIAERTLGQVKSGKCILSAFNSAGDKVYMIDIGFVNQGGAITDSISSKLGKNIALGIAVETISGKIFIEVENKESFDVTISAAYLILN